MKSLKDKNREKRKEKKILWFIKNFQKDSMAYHYIPEKYCGLYKIQPHPTYLVHSLKGAK